MITARNLGINLLLLATFNVFSQGLSGVYKAPQLLERISSKDTVYVVNFWATWCKPCVQELPLFDSVQAKVNNLPVKVLLVSLDFKEESGKVDAFLKKKKINSSCVLLDEVNGNDYIDRFSSKWSGSIPATLLFKAGDKILLEKKTKLSELEDALQKL